MGTNLRCLAVIVGAARGGGRGPNIVFILADDHRYDALGFLGHPFLETPNLDRLAHEGVISSGRSSPPASARPAGPRS